MKKLAVITTHPIQYYAPVFQLLHRRKKIAVKVFYTAGEKVGGRLDRGFNKVVEWDIPLLDGYDFEWLENRADDPGSHHFRGIINPAGIERIKAWQPDTLLVFGWSYHSHLKIIRYFNRKIPIYFRGDSTLLNERNGLKTIIKRIFLTWVYKHIDHAFYVGQNNKAYFKKYGLHENQLSFAPHAIDNERFGISRKTEANELRSALSITQTDILILFAGKFEAVKNLGLLLTAFIKLNKPHVHLLLAGNGPNEDELKEKAKDVPLAGNIHFAGFKNQSYMPVLYQAADLFCLPSKSETWGLSINEAMACSKAVLASDSVGCAADLIKSGRNGEIFKSDDAGSLCERLQQLTESREELVKLGQQSKLIINDWSFLHIAATIENKLMNETKRPH